MVEVGHDDQAHLDWFGTGVHCCDGDDANIVLDGLRILTVFDGPSVVQEMHEDGADGRPVPEGLGRKGRVGENVVQREVLAVPGFLPVKSLFGPDLHEISIFDETGEERIKPV